jgi:branched-chain amino acid aminotransferase
VEVMIATWPWGKYLGDAAQEEGVDVCVSSWRRHGQDSFPSNCKATGGYLNAQLIKMEAVLGGFAEGIALDPAGNVSEGSGENLFVIYRGELLTPPVANSILHGITRDSVITLAREMGLPVKETTVPRGYLYTCDELFFTGTAAEITPVRSVDHVPVGEGKPGPVTRRLLERYLGIATGAEEDPYGWLTPVGRPASVAVGDEATA